MAIKILNNRYRVTKIWKEIITGLEVKRIPFNFCSKMNIITDDKEIPFYSKRDFKKKLKSEIIDKNITEYQIGFLIDYNRLCQKVDKDFHNMCKRINNSNKPSQQNQQPQ